jgi:hypothetical protein
MMDEKDLQGRTPAEERADIGTPAGESPEKGRKRHGTYAISSKEEIVRRGYIESEDKIEEDDFREEGNEISATGGLTGTKVKGGIPGGGTQSGGTPGKTQGIESWEEKS